MKSQSRPLCMLSLMAAMLIVAPSLAHAQVSPEVTQAEKALSDLDRDYAARRSAAIAAVKAARIAQAHRDIEAVAAAAARAQAARAFLATEEIAVVPSRADPAATSTTPSEEKTTAGSADSASVPKPAAAKDLAQDDGKEESKLDEKAKGGEFAGLKFGVGLSLTADIGSSDRVLKASVVNGIVRADKTDNSKARIMLESHYFFTPGPFLGLDQDDFGVGPFVALRPGSDEIIDAISFGGMIGFRRAQGGSDSFNIGVGLVIDPSVQILGEGIKLNRPLPVGETDVRFRETSQKGILGLVSFSF